MTLDQRDLLLRAEEGLRAAKLLLAHAFLDSAASEAYYVMFYTAEAFLEGDGLKFSKHTAVIAKFGETFVKTGRVPAESHRWLIDAERLRCAGDYGKFHVVTTEQAGEVIAQAGKFLAYAQQNIT